MSALPPESGHGAYCAGCPPSQRNLPPPHPTYPHPSASLTLAAPILNAQACRRALADCTGWDGAIRSGAVSSPLCQCCRRPWPVAAKNDCCWGVKRTSLSHALECTPWGGQLGDREMVRPPTSAHQIYCQDCLKIADPHQIGIADGQWQEEIERELCWAATQNTGMIRR
jgi:hypothetical protein